MKFIIYCDFATLKCSREEFAKKLDTFCVWHENHNNFIWEIEVSEMEFIPYSDNICETIYYQFSEFTSPHSLLRICKVSESFGSDAP